ncbi:hypothetical protein FIBSPDRAFT_900282 [Athelia psychrophila]|uniref:Uncharacterized protein n=1 Tax=Athelia psychrophila TaxID=1759441 RepID=A0A165YL36_9AGAM|nr:hypothetical protein FIBSPDRAFT_900282 [Fibularhizoctonia sp. CBS 109695]
MIYFYGQILRGTVPPWILVENGALLDTNIRETAKGGPKSFPINNARHHTALVLASLKGNLDIIKILVVNGVLLDAIGWETSKTSGIVNRNNARHRTALVLASLKGNLDIVKILVENGALLNTEGEDTEQQQHFGFRRISSSPISTTLPFDPPYMLPIPRRSARDMLPRRLSTHPIILLLGGTHVFQWT